jgi:hypothetical protein
MAVKAHFANEEGAPLLLTMPLLILLLLQYLTRTILPLKYIAVQKRLNLFQKYQGVMLSE